MAYRALSASLQFGDDSNLVNGGSQSLVAYQTKDLVLFDQVVRVAPAAAQSANILANVTQGYFLWVSSDYPVKVSVNATSAAATFTLNTNSVAATNVGAPLPHQCLLCITGQVTAVYLTPIASAAQTANVRVFCSADPASAYV